MNKEHMKKTGEELQEYLQFKRRGFKVEAKKGKGAKYKRSSEKTKINQYFDN